MEQNDYANFNAEIFRIIEQLIQSEALRETLRTPLRNLHVVLTGLREPLRVAVGLAGAIGFLAQLCQLAFLLQGYDVSNAMLLPLIDASLNEMVNLCRQLTDCVGDQSKTERAIIILGQITRSIELVNEELVNAAMRAKKDNKWAYAHTVLLAGGAGASAGIAYTSWTQGAAATSKDTVKSGFFGAGIGLVFGVAAGFTQYMRKMNRVEQEASSRLYQLQGNLNRTRSIAEQMRLSSDEGQRGKIDQLIEKLQDLERMISGQET